VERVTSWSKVGPLLLILDLQSPQGLCHVLGLANLQQDSPAFSSEQELLAFKSQMSEAVNRLRNKNKPFAVPEIRRFLLRSVSVLISSQKVGPAVYRQFRG
jgi:hypothetical protein